MQIEQIVISAFITILSLGLLLVSFVSYRKYKNLKLLFVSLVFIIFFIKGILLSLSLFYGEFTSILTDPYIGLFDVIILLLLFIATLKR